MLPSTSADDCDDCTPSYLHSPTQFGPKAAFSTIPFLATFTLLTFIAYRKVYPLLSNPSKSRHGSKVFSQATVAESERPTQTIARRIAALTFSSTIALSAVLTELLLCEISNSFNPTARGAALQVTVTSLLGLLIVAIPLLGIYSVVSKSGYKFRGENKGRFRLAWVFEFAGYAVFLLGFWTIGALLPEPKTIAETLNGHDDLFQACLDRLGITGVTLMALLSGFASVSSIWQNFGPKPKAVSESDLTRKQAGLDATLDMIAEKKEKLHALEKKLSDLPTKGFWSKTVGTFRGNADSQEKKMLEIELKGLETMSSSLEASLGILRARWANELRATTTTGRLAMVFSYSFSCYCIYRILTTTLNVSRRIFSAKSDTNSDTDPVTHAIAIFARNIYPSLNQASWAQQISFLLSGAMLLASFSAVTQTFHLFMKFMPSVLHATKSNFALLISQISGMYVISSALMLRGMMPKEVGSVINSALGAGLLEPAWVQRCFDAFFMTSVVVTAAGIILGRQIGGNGYWDEDTVWDSDMEMGKRS